MGQVIIIDIIDGILLRRKTKGAHYMNTLLIQYTFLLILKLISLVWVWLGIAFYNVPFVGEGRRDLFF